MNCKFIPAVINDEPTPELMQSLAKRKIRMMDVVLRIAMNIHIRCRLSESQNWKCCWCGVECSELPKKKNSATIEHVIPRSEGGRDEWDNYAMACFDCNQKRGVLSVEDMILGNFPKPRNKEVILNPGRRHAHVAKRIRTAKKLHERGWIRIDGSALSPKGWLDSLHLKTGPHKSVKKAVIELVGEEAYV